jgi:hypothetical protein
MKNLWEDIWASKKNLHKINQQHWLHAKEQQCEVLPPM